MVIISNTGLFKKKNEGSKVGLFLKKPESNFSNGCVQQAIFIRELLEKAGYACEYLSIEPKFTKIDDIAQPDVKVVFDYMELSSYKLLIFVSLNLVSPENDNFINMIKRSKSKCVNLICGNVFILHQEEFVFNTHNILSKFVNNLYDEYWVLEMYPFAVEYIRLMTNKPTHLLPYVWNDTVVNSYIKNKQLKIDVNYHDVNRTKINVVIFEPNMSIHKTCLVPLMICERYNQKYPGMLNKVYVFCGEKVIKFQNGEFIRGLSLYKEGKLEAYSRMVMPAVFSFIRKNNRFINVVLSHNIMNNLNFLHLELIALDIPIIHNCLPFKENGLYYDDYSTCDAIDMIEKVRTNFYLNSDYKSGKFNILKTFHPDQIDRQDAWVSHVQRLSGLKPSNSSLAGTGVIKELVHVITKLGLFIQKQSKIDNVLFYNGIGIIILLQNEGDLPLLQLTINSLNALHNQTNVEIVYSNANVTKDIIQKNVGETSYQIEYLHIDTEAGTDTLNEYRSCVFSTFEKGVFVNCGTIFIESPVDMVHKYLHEDSNSFRYFPSFRRVKTMAELEKDIQAQIASKFSKFKINDKEFMSDNSVLFFDKQDKICSKVLGTLCEICKLHRTICINTNLIKLVCDLNFENPNSIIETRQQVLGQMKDGFKGYGIRYDDIIVCYTRCDDSDDTNHLSVDIIEHNIALSMSDNKELTFIGKVNAKRIPKSLRPLIF